MAGMGKRMRPHTLTVPKPLIPVAGKPIVQRLVEDIAKVLEEPIDEIAFIIKESFGENVENKLKNIAENLGAKGTIHYQDVALGTAHAILCAQSALEGNVVIAFADTLFKADFKLNSQEDGIIWTKEIEDPRQFGVVKVNEENIITEFHEKPEVPVSNLAIIGIYYFKDGEQLKKELQFLIDNDIKDKGEYQLTNALENLKAKGIKFTPGTVTEWLDCGNKNATVYSNQRVLEFIKSDEKMIADSAQILNSTIIEPCLIGENVSIENSVVGPHVSIGANSSIEKSVVSNSIIQNETQVKNAVIENSMLGNSVVYQGKAQDLSIGDFCTSG